MLGLATSRALVVDNDPIEAAGMMRALASRGVGAVHLSGLIEDEPNEKLTGIRFAALDLYLTDGVSSEQAAGQVAGLLQRVLGTSNGPYAAVAWTKHADELAYLKRAIARLPAELRPLTLIPMQKSDYLSGETWLIEPLAAQIAKALSSPRALAVIVDWEQLTHQAATDTTWSLLPSGSASWAKAAEQSLSALLREGASQRQMQADPPDADVMRRALFSALQPIHYDYVEQAVTTGQAATRPFRALARLANGLALPHQHVARLNSSLLLGPTLKGLWPGHVYELGSLHPLTWPTRPLEKLVDELRSEMMRGPVQKKENGEKDEAFAVRVEAWRAKVECFRPVAVEVSPACDVFQGNLRESRLVLGVLIPFHMTETGGGSLRIKDADLGPTKRAIGPLLMPGVAGTLPQELILSARFVTGCDPTSLDECTAIARLREGAIHDVQSWVTSQGGRLGQLQVRVK